jgi:DNA-binding IclR family transcriptional regulator
LGEVVALATLSGTQIILIESIKTQQVLNVNTNEGVSIPAHATASGKAILAFLPETEAERIINEAGFAKLTDNTITSMKAFKNQLSKVKERGFATAVDENNYGLSAVAAPIRSNTGDVTASLTVMVPTARVTEKKLAEEYSLKVIQTAERISFDSGYRKKNSYQS